MNKSSPLFVRLARLLLTACALLAAVFGGINQPAQAAPAPDGWLPFGSEVAPAAPAISLVQADAYTITVQAAIPGANVQATTLNARSYAALSGEGFVQGGEVGAPNLPVVRRDIEVPFGAEISLEVLALTSRTTTLAEAGLTGPIAPVQAPQPKCGDPLAANEPAAEIYGAAAAYPEAPVRIAGEYTVRGHRVVTVEIWPVAYTPATGGLELISEVSFRLKLAGSDLAATNAEAERLRSDAFETILARNILNYNQGRGAIAAKTPENYLIITADVYEAGLADFVALKQSQGFNVTLANLTTVGGTTTTAIKNYIVAAYNGANPPAYLLLVGDHNDGAESLPAWPFPGYIYYTDLFYGTMGGASDYVPDMHIGRFPVRETSQLANMVSNNRYYEDDVTGAEDWVKKAAFLATDDSGNYDIAEGTQNYVINTYTLPKGYSGIFPNNPQAGGDKLYAITYNAESADVVASINDDRVMVIYTGHGSPTSWAGPSLGQAQVRALTGVISPYVVGHACVTSDFTTNESFGDTWVIQNGKGALTYVGTSNNSYWDEDDVMERVIFDTLYADPLDVPSVGEIKWAGLMAVQTTYPSSANYYWEEYHLFGDPSLVIVMGPRTPDFTLAADPTSFAMCSTDTVTADLTVGSINDFVDPVTLTVDAPTGLTPTLDPVSPITPPGTTVLSLAGDGTTAFGAYTVTVTGVAGTSTHTADIALNVYSFHPAAPALTAPANGATDVAPLPVFTWGAVAQAVTYRLEVAKDAAFTNIILDVPGLTATTYTPTTAFETDTRYYWRVTGTNPCGEGAISAAFNFRTRPGPGDCPAGTTPVTLYTTTFEDAPAGWTDASTGSYHWAESTVRYHSADTAWLGTAPAAIADQRLVSPAITLPADQGPLSLDFWHYRTFDSPTSCNDGAILEISTNGGTTWAQIPAAALLTDPYTGTVRSGVFNPLAGKPAWCGTADWTWSVVDLNAYAGQTVQFRFRLGTGSSGSAEGWYVDDVTVQSCLADEPPDPIKIYLPGILK